MNDAPTYKDVVTAMAEAIAATKTRHNDHTYLPDAEVLATAALRAFVAIVPKDNYSRRDAREIRIIIEGEDLP